MPPVSSLPPLGSSPWWLHQEPVLALVVGGDVDVFSTRLLGGEAPSVDVVRTLLLLIRVRSFLLQLLAFVFCPPVLEPHLHLGERQRSAHREPGTAVPDKGWCCKLSCPWRPSEKEVACDPRSIPRATLSCLSFGQVQQAAGCEALPPPSCLLPQKPQMGGEHCYTSERGHQGHCTLLAAPQPGAHHPGAGDAQHGESS